MSESLTSLRKQLERERLERLGKNFEEETSLFQKDQLKPEFTKEFNKVLNSIKKSLMISLKEIREIRNVCITENIGTERLSKIIKWIAVNSKNMEFSALVGTLLSNIQTVKSILLKTIAAEEICSEEVRQGWNEIISDSDREERLIKALYKKYPTFKDDSTFNILVSIEEIKADAEKEIDNIISGIHDEQVKVLAECLKFFGEFLSIDLTKSKFSLPEINKIRDKFRDLVDIYNKLAAQLTTATGNEFSSFVYNDEIVMDTAEDEELAKRLRMEEDEELARRLANEYY